MAEIKKCTRKNHCRLDITEKQIYDLGKTDQWKSSKPNRKKRFKNEGKLKRLRDNRCYT